MLRGGTKIGKPSNMDQKAIEKEQVTERESKFSIFVEVSRKFEVTRKFQSR